MGRGEGAALSEAAAGVVGTFVGAGDEDGEATGATRTCGFVAVEVSSTGADGPPGWFNVDFCGGGGGEISVVLRGTPVAGVEEESGGTVV